MIRGRDEVGNVYDKMICLNCHDGLFEHEGECVDSIPPPQSRLIWCPPDFENCGLCRQNWWWNEEE